jgi:alpha-amylase
MRNINRVSGVLVFAVSLFTSQLGCGPNPEQFSDPTQSAQDPEASPGSEVGTTDSALYTGGGTDVLLQGFHWGAQSGWWNTVASNAAAIGQNGAGFTMVWLPPPMRTGDTHGYLPTEWYSLDMSPYGTQAQLQSAISALHNNGVKALADIVINHRNGTNNWADFSNPAFGTNLTNNHDNDVAICAGDEYFSSSQGSGHPSGASDTGEGYSAARDLDHKNTNVQNAIKSWLGFLKSTVGFDGWRYDFVKGYGGTYVGMYNDATSPYFSVGEDWPTNGFSSGNAGDWRGQISSWISATGGKSAAFDFVTKPLLAEALQNNNFGILNNGGKPNGLIGTNPAQAVTFLDNHDTGPSPYGQSLWSFPNSSGDVYLLEAYAYILTHPGTPSVFWPHYFNWGSTVQTAIKNMIAIRKAQGITSTSSVNINQADGSVYAATISGTQGSTAMKMGSGNWAPSAGLWVVQQSGTNYAIWTGASSTAPSVPSGVTATATSSTAITVSWSASTDAASYTVYRSTSASSGFASIGTTSNTSYGDSGLATNTKYYYYVTATNGAGTSGASATASATTLSGGTGTVTTTFRVHYDVGLGNSIYLRGSIAPLSWTVGVATEWTSGNVWTWSTTAIASGAAIEFKALINDTQWSDGANLTGTGGSTIDVTPTFNGNFYDVMDNIATNWTSSGGTGSKVWKQGTLNGGGVAACLNCSTEASLTLKNGLTKNAKVVTLGFKYALKGLSSSEYLRVDVSKNSGSTWTQVGSYTGTKGATNVLIDISAYKTTSATLKLRFRAKLNGASKWATVDNVTVSIRN